MKYKKNAVQIKRRTNHSSGAPAFVLATENGGTYAHLTADVTSDLAPEGCVFLDPHFPDDKIGFVEENGLGEYVGTVAVHGEVYPCVKPLVPVDKWEEVTKCFSE